MRLRRKFDKRQNLKYIVGFLFMLLVSEILSIIGWMIFGTVYSIIDEKFTPLYNLIMGISTGLGVGIVIGFGHGKFGGEIVFREIEIWIDKISSKKDKKTIS